jgi:hypothetical protein
MVVLQWMLEPPRICAAVAGSRISTEASLMSTQPVWVGLVALPALHGSQAIPYGE